MKLAVFSYKLAWEDDASPSGYSTDGGFPLQMKALASLFEETHLVLPIVPGKAAGGITPLEGSNLSVTRLSVPRRTGMRRKLEMIPWAFRNGITLVRELFWADAVHTPIPSDIGTIAMILAYLFRKPLLVRHCGNWARQRTAAEHFWRWFMERFAGGRNVMFATGGAAEPPSRRNPALRWIFSTSLTEQQLSSLQKNRTLLENHSPRLVIVCRQERGKGTDVLIRSLALLVEAFPLLILDVVGEGGALGEFRELAASLGVAGRVNFHGRVPQSSVLKFLQDADIFCYPTASEGFPKVVLEALACGLPVVTTPVSVLPRLTGGAGILVNDATPVAVAGAIRECLTPDKYASMSRCAVSIAMQYSLERWLELIARNLREAWGSFGPC